MLVAQAIVEAARDYHPAFDRRHHPDPVATRYLTGLVQTLAARAVRRDPLALSTELTFAMPLGEFSDGIELPHYIKIHGVVAETDSGSMVEVKIIAWEARGNTPGPTCWLVGNRLYLGHDANYWFHVSRLGVRLTLAMPPVVNLDTIIPLPESAREPLVTGVANFFAMRQQLGPVYAAMADTSVQQWLDELSHRRAGEPFRIVETWP